MNNLENKEILTDEILNAIDLIISEIPEGVHKIRFVNIW